MKLLATLINHLSETAAGKHSFIIKGWDELTNGKDPTYIVGDIDVKVTYDINSDDEPENIKAVANKKVDVMDAATGFDVLKSEPAGTDITKLPGFVKTMWGSIEDAVQNDMEASAKWDKENNFDEPM